MTTCLMPRSQRNGRRGDLAGGELDHAESFGKKKGVEETG